jgi:Niemann-Pick C1 protein
VIALLNIGWKSFAVETDPVRLWVSPTSESAMQKRYFDENFGPFYRPQQVFVMGLPHQTQESEMTANSLPSSNVMSYANLDWWLTHERAISDLVSSPNNYTLADVCFAPAGPGTPCVVQSVSAWLGTEMDQWGDEWRERVQECAETPSGCLPDFGQPIDPKLVLGGTGTGNEWLDAKSLVVTWVINNSLDEAEVAKAEEWERALERYLGELVGEAKEAGVQLAYSTGVSLEQELNKVRLAVRVRKYS